MTSRRLTRDRYVDALHREGERLLLASEDSLDRAVPTCPGWTVRDVVAHVGTVYGHKVAALEHGRRPEPGEWDAPPAGSDVVAWCHGLLHRVANDLSGLALDDPAWTWCEPDQTAGFWHRRLALESAVHRVDVEAAVGGAGPVDADLAVDGVDEVLRVMLPDAGVVEVQGPQVEGDEVWVAITGVGVAGAPSDLLLWLWGRAPDGAVRIDGEASMLRALLRDATQ